MGFSTDNPSTDPLNTAYFTLQSLTDTFDIVISLNMHPVNLLKLWKTV